MRSLLAVLVLLALVLPTLPAAPGPAAGDDDVTVVIAHIDAGLNPYNLAFRDTSARAFEYPGAYIPGYPAGVPALDLCLDAAAHPDCATWQGAMAHDAAIWGDAGTPSSIKPGQLYWIPGTKIVGAMCWPSSDGARCIGGGTNCPLVAAPPANIVGDPTADCIDHPIVDDHGHGTMTASRMAGNEHSLCPECRIVSIEGLTPDAVLWVAKQGWIDVQTNSWVDLVPPPVNAVQQVLDDNDPTGHTLRDQVLGNSTSVEVKQAAQLMPVFFASGNGAAYITGFAPTPTYLLSTGVPGVILVGAHDNGHVAPWSGAPAMLVADGYGGWAAMRTRFDSQPDPIACCTSAASPYAAGGAAAIVREARRILHDEGTGVHDGIVAQKPPGLGIPLPGQGPLADGAFTLDELKAVLFHTAEARPGQGKDDGLLHWMGDPTAPPPADLIAQYGPGANPFCQGCWTLPVPWSSVPDGAPQFPLIGYGAVNERSVALARDVLRGSAAEPQRAQDDQLYALDQQARGLVFANA